MIDPVARQEMLQLVPALPDDYPEGKVLVRVSGTMLLLLLVKAHPTGFTIDWGEPDGDGYYEPVVSLRL